MEIKPHDPGLSGDEVNSDDNRPLHRITSRPNPSDRATFAGLVRHELEHARQFEAGAGIVNVHDFIESSTTSSNTTLRRLAEIPRLVPHPARAAREMLPARMVASCTEEGLRPST